MLRLILLRFLTLLTIIKFGIAGRVFQLNPILQHHEALTPLPDGRLLESDDREIDYTREAPFEAYEKVQVEATAERYLNPSALDIQTAFKEFQFSAGTLQQQLMKTKKTLALSKFAFAELKSTHNEQNIKLYGLQLSDNGESAYWLPQGGSIDIPRKPNADQPKYVFTPDFCGCSLTVTEIDNNMYRVRHVDGNKEGVQFNNLDRATKGGDVTYAMQFKDYGFYRSAFEADRFRNVNGFAFMHFNGDRWQIRVQHQVAPSTIYSASFDSQGRISSATIEPKFYRGRLASRVAESKVFSFYRSVADAPPYNPWKTISESEGQAFPGTAVRVPDMDINKVSAQVRAIQAQMENVNSIMRTVNHMDPLRTPYSSPAGVHNTPFSLPHPQVFPALSLPAPKVKPITWHG